MIKLEDKKKLHGEVYITVSLPLGWESNVGTVGMEH